MMERHVDFDNEAVKISNENFGKQFLKIHLMPFFSSLNVVGNKPH